MESVVKEAQNKYIVDALSIVYSIFFNAVSCHGLITNCSISAVVAVSTLRALSLRNVLLKTSGRYVRFAESGRIM